MVKQGPVILPGHVGQTDTAQGMPMSQFMAPPERPDHTARSAAEIAADMQAYERGLKETKAKAEAKAEETPKTEPTEKTQGDLDLEEDSLYQSYVDRLNNPARRRMIEANLEPMKIEDLVRHGELRQTVHLKHGDAVFRTPTGEEDLAVKKMLYEVEGPDRYILDRFSLLNLCLSLVSHGGTVAPPHVKEDGEFDAAFFKTKFQKMLKKPVPILADLQVNYTWFDDRVRLVVSDLTGLSNG